MWMHDIQCLLINVDIFAADTDTVDAYTAYTLDAIALYNLWTLCVHASAPVSCHMCALHSTSVILFGI